MEDNNPKAHCEFCGKSFSSVKYLSQHLWAEQHRMCLDYYHLHVHGQNSTAEERAAKRRKRKNRLDGLLRENENLLNDVIGVSDRGNTNTNRNEKDDSVFDFVDDSTPEVSCPRINESALSAAENEEEVMSENEEGNFPNPEQFALNDGADEAEAGGMEPGVGIGVPDVKEKDKFYDYVDFAHREFNGQLCGEMKAAIELMKLLNQRGGSLDAYEEISKWRISNSDGKGLGHVSSDQLHKHLMDRYGLHDLLPIEKTVELPFSKEKVSLATHCFKAQTSHLLTDPRIEDHHYLFFNDDPYADMPPLMDDHMIGDINTGRAYRETYNELIAPQPWTPCGRRRVLNPHVLYMDGCQLGSFGNSALEILKFTVGLFKREVRDKAWAWRNIGFMKKVLAKKKESEQNIRNSEHIDASDMLPAEDYRPLGTRKAKGSIPDFDPTLHGGGEMADFLPAQDFHKMLQVLLSGYKELEDQGGMEWDLCYKGQTCHLLLVPFIIFIKADSVEADKFCGVYGSKAHGVKCVCRVCCCPTMDADKPYLYPQPEKKTPQMLQGLMSQGTAESKKRLVDISQHPVLNALHEVGWGRHDEAGVHGSIPWENLHMLQLNWYKNVRDCFFEQAGGNLAKKMDNLCVTYSKLVRRQSDRNMPRKNFDNGVREGLLQAHHMTGVMLIMAFAVRSSKGRHMLQHLGHGDNKANFATSQKIRDWSKCLEMLLMFEQWLNQDELKAKSVERAKVKVKEVMAMVCKVANRTKGMGDKRGVFHGLIHIPQMILNFGVPNGFNTQHREKDHKLDKKTAKRTQQRSDTMDMKTGEKIVEREAVDLGMYELQTGYTRWHYFRRVPGQPESNEEIPEPRLSGVKVAFQQNQLTDEVLVSVVSRSNGKDRYKYDDQVMASMEELLITVEPYLSCIFTYGVLTVHSPDTKNKSQLYRAEPYRDGNPWYDWGVFHWSDELGQPRVVLGQMKAFVDLRELPLGNSTNYSPGIYVFMEIATYNSDDQEQRQSDILLPYLKKQSRLEHLQDSHNELRFVHISKLRAPAVVVPDLGNENRRAYLRMMPLAHWGSLFDLWLQQPHRREWED